MNFSRVFTTVLAATLSVPFVGASPAKAYSCGQLLVGMETAYNNFQKADDRGDEAAMYKNYIAFEALVAQAEGQGCK